MIEKPQSTHADRMDGAILLLTNKINDLMSIIERWATDKPVTYNELIRSLENTENTIRKTKSVARVQQKASGQPDN